MISLLCFAAAVLQREGGHQLQSEAEGEVPASPANQAHFSSPTSTQEHFQREEPAEGHEGGSPAKVRIQLFSFTPWKNKRFPHGDLGSCQEQSDLSSHTSLMENLTDGAGHYDVVSMGITYSFTACVVD